jgi:site-specific DNA-methyltransferase (adenine-specific)
MTPYYQDEAVTIYHGDCRVVAPSVGRCALLLTDPPYGIGASSGVGKYGREKWTATDSHWDGETPPRWLLEMLIASADRAIVWGGNYFALPPSRNYLVWDKGAGFKGRDFAECEYAWCSWDANARVYHRDPLARGDYRGKEHPTEKPEPVMAWCIDIADVAGLIVDPFMGSGTTLVAAKRLGRKAIGIELEERYCEIAANRLRQGALDLFGEATA